MPLLARKILDMQEKKDKRGPVNLKGYMVGNAVTDDVIESNGQIEFAYGMGLIDPTMYSRLKKDCPSGFWNPKQGGRGLS